MRLVFCILFAITLFVACSKKGGEGSHTDNGIVDTGTFSRGYVEASLQELQKIGFVEDLDSSLIVAFRGGLSTSYEIPGLPIPGNQFKQDNCIGWVLAHGLMGYFYTQIEKKTFKGSPAFIFNLLNTSPKNTMSLPAALSAVQEFGVCDAFYMRQHAPFGDPITIEAFGNADQHKIAEYKRFKTVNHEQIKALLKKNFPLPFGMKIDIGFSYPEQWENNPAYRKETDGRYVYKQTSEEKVGQHALLLVGYDDEIGAYKVMNSWGNGWGNGGFIWIDYQLFEQQLVITQGQPNIFWAYALAVKTDVVINIKSTTATSGGIVENEAGSSTLEKGVCWSTSRKPVVSSDNFTNEGPGNGIYVSELTKLKPKTKYYVRAYLKKKTDNGFLYLYGLTDSFTTKELILMENSSIATSSQDFEKGKQKLFSFRNPDLTVIPGLNYNLVTTSNNTNNNVTITKATVSNGFNLTLNHNTSGDVVTSFDILYDGAKVQTINATIHDFDSTNYYKNLVLGTWSNKWYSDFNGTGNRDFYEEDIIEVRTDGVAMWVESRYYNGQVSQNQTDVRWSIFRSGDIYIMQMGAQSGRITPDMTFTNVGGYYTIITAKK